MAAGRHVRIWPPPALFLGYLLNSIVLVYCKEVVLLDTYQEPTKLGWTRYPLNPGGTDMGWLEISDQTPDFSAMYRAYTSCYVTESNVNNWLRLPFLDRKGANSLHIEITFTMRKCSGVVDAASLRQCKETFNLYYYEAGGDIANDDIPTWDSLTYTMVDKIAADNLFEQKDTVIENVETRRIPFGAGGVRGVYFAIQDEGACVVMKRVRVYYITCDSAIGNFAFFPETPTGSTSVVEQAGQCVDHAVKKTELTYLCQNDGQWFGDIKGECVCMPGYQGNQTANTCSACSSGYFKWSEGLGPCQACPTFSNSDGGEPECTCNRMYYRSPTDPKSAACTRPPSEPRSLDTAAFSSTSVTLTWEQPHDLGGRLDLNYRIVCRNCSTDVLYRPGWRGFNTTRVNLNNLVPGRSYEVIVYAENGVTNISGITPRHAAKTVSTQPIARVTNIRRTSMGPRHLTISWDVPAAMRDQEPTFEVRYYPRTEAGKEQVKRTQGQNLTIHEFMLETEYVFMVRADTTHGLGQYSEKLYVQTGQHGSTIVGVRRMSISNMNITIAWDVAKSVLSSITKYEVQYYPKSQSENVISKFTYAQNLSITSLMPDTEYEFQVRGQLAGEWSDFSEALLVSTAPSSSSATPIGIIVGSIVAVILCMAIATIMIIILLRRNRPNCSEKKDCDAYSHVIQYPPLEHHINGGYGGLTMPLFPSPGSVHSSVRTYVDPHTYEDPNQAVREFTREIDACHITIESVIGGGEFGDVCKGKLRMPGRLEMTVAIKTLKPGATEKNRLDFLTEASIMGQFDDPNVIFLEGVVTKSNPIMIVTEYMANGSLDTFLRNNDGKFTIIQLVGMMRGVASGMKYLSEMSFVHRDLAARNILVNESLVCKVADFGLSREIESDTTEGAYTTTGGKIPVRWTAPEAIAYRKFTSSSDVWSYGVVMWEIVSYGERPYYNWSNQDVIKAVDKGYRLPPPMECPEAIHQLMLDCWQKERSHRPKLGQIVKTLDKLIRAPELLRKQAKPRPHNFIDPSTPDMTSLSSVEDWLISIKMDRYLNLFLSAGLQDMEQVRHITVRDLLNMGINLVGHQKKIMNSIQTFRAQTGEGVQPHMLQAALV